MNFFRVFSFFWIINIISFQAAAQEDSCSLRISLLTCAPGQELYSTFGHTAIRIIDNVSHSDSVYNYGTFNFDDPGFYLKFVKGRLDYFLSADDYPHFLDEYQREQRSVTELELNLSCAEKERILHALEKNMHSASRTYRYNFLYDNCTTRVRDLLFASLPGSNVQKPVVPENTTSRNLIHAYLDANGEPWSKLALDIISGSKVDKPVDSYASMFLPACLMKGISNAQLYNAKPLAKEKKWLLNLPSPIVASGRYVPFFVISILCALVFTVYLLRNKTAAYVSGFIDSFLIYIIGILGVLLLFLWFGTDHTVCQDNYNLLWALPTNIIADFFLWRNPLWLRRYFYAAFIINALLLITWFWLPQEINIAIAPVVILLLFRYAKLAQRQS